MLPQDLIASDLRRDPRAFGILAKTIYRELRQSGLVEEDVMAITSELLSLVASGMTTRRAMLKEAEENVPCAE